MAPAPCIGCIVVSLYPLFSSGHIGLHNDFFKSPVNFENSTKYLIQKYGGMANIYVRF